MPATRQGLEGGVAIITGASSGIGAALARALGLVALLAAGCQRQADPSMADYLPPLEEGRTLVYEMTEGPRRITRIVRVARERDGTVWVRTESSVQDADRTGPATPVGDLDERYRFDPRQGAIFWQVGTRPEVVLLKGPLAPGTRWTVTAITDGAVDVDARHGGGAHRRVEGVCRIDRLGDRTVLGRTQACVEVACEFPDPEVAFSSRTVACRGLGVVQTDETVTVTGEATPSRLGERLVEVR